MTSDLELDTDVTLTTLLNLHRDGIMTELRVSLPGKVITYDPATQTASVLPMINRVVVVRGEEREVTLPILHEVPVRFPRGGGWAMTFPLVAGDLVWLNFGDRDLSSFNATGKQQRPASGRKHSLSDAVAEPALSVQTNPIPGASATDLRIARDDGTNEIVMKPDGTVLIGADASKGAARAQDPTEVNATTDQKTIAFVQAINVALSGLSALGTTPLPSLGGAIASIGATFVASVSAAGGVPDAFKGVITQGSGKVMEAD